VLGGIVLLGVMCALAALGRFPARYSALADAVRLSLL
jgi:hypothetical protein